MARFDVEAARTAGYGVEEIASFLAQRSGLDLQRAMQAGYTHDEIVQQLAAREAEGEGAVPPPPPPAPRQRGTGLQEAGRSLALGVRTAMHGAAALPGALYDVASLPVHGLAALTGRQGPRSSQQLVDSAADAMGLPEPENARERIVQRVGTELGAAATGGVGGAAISRAARAAGPAVTPGMRGAAVVGDALASHPGSQAMGALGAGLAGGAASEAAPDSPMADFGAALAGGVAGSAVAPIAQGTARGVRSAFGQFTREGVENAAAAALLRASDDPTTLAARLRREGRGLEGSERTAGEAAGDAGLLQAERAFRSTPEGMPIFASLDQRRDGIRTGAIDGLEERLPGEASGAEEVARGVGVYRDREAAGIEAQRAQAVADAEAARLAGLDEADWARTRAVEQAEREREQIGNRWMAADRSLAQRTDRAVRDLPAGETPERAGAVIREDADAGRQAAWERTREAFADVDPEGRSRIPILPILSVAEETMARLFRPLGSPPPAQLEALLDRIRSWIDRAGPEAPFANLSALRSDLTDLQGEFGKGGRASYSRAGAVVGEMKRVLDDQTRRASEMWERPTQPRRFGDMEADEALEAAAQHPDVARALYEAASSGPSAGLIRQPTSLNLVQFLRQHGGLRNNRGEMRYLGANHMPGLWNDKWGLSLHNAMEKAIGDGYFPGHDIGSLTEREFLDALSEGLKGRHRYPEGFDPGRVNADHAMRARDDLIQTVEERGGRYVSGDPDATMATLRQQGDDPARIGWGAGEPPPGQPGYVVDPVAQGTAFTPEQAERYREAIAARREQGQKFESGAMGRVISRGEGGARTGDSAVVAQFFHGGDGAASDVQQFISALGDSARAVKALTGYAAQSLRDYATGADGSINAARARAWIGRHRAALRQLPEVAEKFATVEKAARTAEIGAKRGKQELTAADRAQRAAERGADVERGRTGRKVEAEARDANFQAQRDATEAQAEIDRGATRYWLRGTEPEVAISRALNAGNAEANMRQLKNAMKGDAPALRGLRRAYAEEWLRVASDTQAQHASGARRMSADKSRRFVERTQRAAAVLFGPEDRARIGQIAEDFRSGSMVNSVGRAIGSNTAQNLASQRSNASTAYILGRATSGMFHGEPGFLPASLMRPLQWVMRAPEEQVRRVLVDLLMDPARASKLVDRVSADNLRMVERYAERRFGQRAARATGEAGVRAAARAIGSAEAGEGQREARRGYADGGVVDDESVVRLGRASRGDTGQSLGLHMTGLDGDDSRVPQSRFQVPYTEDDRDAMQERVPFQASVPGRRPALLGGLDYADRPAMPEAAPLTPYKGISPAGVGQRAPVARGGRDYEGRMTPQGEEAVRNVAETLLPSTPTDVALTIAAPGLGGVAAKGFMRGLERVGMHTAARRAPIAAGVAALDADEAEARIRAYHGSPHRFDRFDISRIGSGEGAQAYGHGLYFTETEDVARGYRDRLARPLVSVDGVEISGGGVYPSNLGALAQRLGLSRQEYDALYHMHGHLDVDSAVENLRDQASRTWRGPTARREWQDRADTLDSMRGRVRVTPQGHMYEVNLDADSGRFLDWDKPVSNQPQAVADGVHGAMMRSGIGRQVANHIVQNRLGREAYSAATRGEYMPHLRHTDEGAAGASQALRQEGIPGIRYLDQYSRRDGVGTSNYVMFDDAPIEILRRYARGGLAEVR